jgi:hypothetical protein
MRNRRRNLRGTSVLPKTLGYRAILLRIRLRTLWRSEIYMNLKIDAYALNRRWRRFRVRRTVRHIYQGQWRQYAGKCACVYGICSVCSVNNKIENESNLTNCSMRSIRRTFRGTSVLPKTQRNRDILLRIRLTTWWRSEIHINLKIDADAFNRRRRRFHVRRREYHIYQGQGRQYVGKCARVYGICSLKKKI